MSTEKSLSSLVCTIVCDWGPSDFINYLLYLHQQVYSIAYVCAYLLLKTLSLNSGVTHQFMSKPLSAQPILMASDNNLHPSLSPQSMCLCISCQSLALNPIQETHPACSTQLPQCHLGKQSWGLPLSHHSRMQMGW